MIRPHTIFLGLTGLVVAYCIGRITVQTTGSPTTAPARVVERRHDHTIVEHGASLDLDAVRAIVHDELAQQAPPANVAEREQPVDADRLARAKVALGEGMADARWTNDDRERLRPMLATMSRTEIEEILLTLFRTINAQKLRIETAGPLI